MHHRSSSSHDPNASIFDLPVSSGGGILKEMDVEERRRKKTCGAVTRSGGICKNPIITRFGICPVHVSQARGYRASDAKRRKKIQYHRKVLTKSKSIISRSPSKEISFSTPSPRADARNTRAIPDATFNSLSLPTSPLTDEEIEAETFWNTPVCSQHNICPLLGADNQQDGECGDLSRILIFNED